MRFLLTAFEPYGDWEENSSWLTLVELLTNRPSGLNLTTRRYPVDLPKLREQLNKDLANGFDVVIHLGQSPGASSIELEAIALNVAGLVEDRGEVLSPIVPSAPVAFQTNLHLTPILTSLRSSGFPASVSYHAGTFLCNATMYLTHYWYHTREERANALFVHLPLATEQVASHIRPPASLPKAKLADAVRNILTTIAEGGSRGVV